MRRVATILLVVLLLTLSSSSFAADAPPIAGELSLSGKVYKLTHVVAYEMKRDDEKATVVLASDRPINLKIVKDILQKNDGNDEELSLRQPHVKLNYDKDGKVTRCYAYAEGFTTSNSGSTVEGEFKLADDHAIGKAKMPTTGEEKLQRSFDFSFNVGLLNSGAETETKLAPLAKLGVTGTFKANGQAAKLAFVSARRIEPFSDKPSLQIVLTEKDHSKDKRPDIKAGFGGYGSALIISTHEDGNIFGCEVAHAALTKGAFSSSGSVSTDAFQIEGGQVQGKLSSHGEQKTFGQTWEVDLTFAAPWAETPKTEPAKTANVKPTVDPTKTKPTVPSPKPSVPNPKPETPAADSLNVKDLAIPATATDLEYKAIVKHVQFNNPADVKATCADFTAKLAAQGWTKDGADLVTPKSAILKRKRGEAKLTIFVKPQGTGSEVKMFTEGLEWE